MTVYIGFGNSDDKLSQREWVLFQIELKQAIHDTGAQILGEWHSYPDSIYQNACYAFDGLNATQLILLQRQIKELAHEFKQDAVAWSEVTETLFIGPEKNTLNKHPNADHWASSTRQEPGA